MGLLDMNASVEPPVGAVPCDRIELANRLKNPRPKDDLRTGPAGADSG